MADAEKIIRAAGKRMHEMLKSVYDYNSRFLLNESDEKLLDQILFAMSKVDRKFFYADLQDAYSDTALPIGQGQTISQPSTVARMLILAGVKQGDDVLEVGTGSGWNASLISFLVYPGIVNSVERVYELVKKADKNISGLKGYFKTKQPHEVEKVSKLSMFAESVFEKGKVWKKKYDKIILTAGITQGEETKVEDLADSLLKKKGVLVCPYKEGPLLIYKKDGKLKKHTTKEQYVFVPLLD